MSGQDENMQRIHLTIPKNILDLLDEIQDYTGAPRAVIIRRAIKKAYEKDYPEYFKEDSSL